MPRKPTKRATVKPIDSDLPDWVTETPDELEYILQIDEWATGMNSPVQRIDLTRAEYLELKLHLAGMRGHKIPVEETHAA